MGLASGRVVRPDAGSVARRIARGLCDVKKTLTVRLGKILCERRCGRNSTAPPFAKPLLPGELTDNKRPHSIGYVAVEVERETGFEPAALCLGSRCATIAPLPRALTLAAFDSLVKYSSERRRAASKSPEAPHPLPPPLLEGKQMLASWCGRCATAPRCQQSTPSPAGGRGGRGRGPSAQAMQARQAGEQ